MRSPLRILSGRSARVRGAIAVLAAASALTVAVPAGAAATAHKPPVLGARSFHSPALGGKGWGYAHPAEIFNGGDPSGLVTHITWTGWGAAQSYGYGKNYIFKPGGGYYPQPVTIELRAHVLNRCSAGGVLAYTQLEAREPSTPGGPMGPWFSWSSTHSICKSG